MTLELCDFGSSHPSKVIFSMLPCSLYSVRVDWYLLVRFLVDIDLFERIFVEDSKVIVTNVIERAVCRPAITVNSCTFLDMSVYDWKEGVLTSVGNRVEDDLVGFTLNHAENPYLKKKNPAVAMSV